MHFWQQGVLATRSVFKYVYCLGPVVGSVLLPNYEGPWLAHFWTTLHRNNLEALRVLCQGKIGMTAALNLFLYAITCILKKGKVQAAKGHS